jgi:hypothetical protein
MSRTNMNGNASRKLKVVKAIIESGDLHSFSELIYNAGATRDGR